MAQGWVGGMSFGLDEKGAGRGLQREGGVGRSDTRWGGLGCGVVGLGGILLYIVVSLRVFVVVGHCVRCCVNGTRASLESQVRRLLGLIVVGCDHCCCPVVVLVVLPFYECVCVFARLCGRASAGEISPGAWRPTSSAWSFSLHALRFSPPPLRNARKRSSAKLSKGA